MSLADAAKRFVVGKPVTRKPTVAVEIGADWVKVAQCRFGLSGPSLAKFSAKPVVADDSLDGALSEALREARCSRKDLILCLPRNQVAVRILRVPADNPDEIAKIVHLQAGRLTPYSSDEVVSAYDVLGRDEDGYSTVMLAIARRRLISERRAAIERVGGTVGSVSAGTEGVCRHLATALGEQLKSTSPRAVLNVDSDFSELLVFANGKVAFSKSILIGSSSLLEDLARWQGELINEIVTGLDQFKKENEGAGSAEQMILLGIDEMPSLASALQEVCGMKTVVADPVAHTPGRKAAAQRERTVSPSAVIGCTLAPEGPGIDLMPPEDRLGKVMARRRNQLNQMGVLGLFIVTLLLAILVMSYYERRFTLGMIEERIGEVEGVAERTEEKVERINQIHARLSAAGDPANMLAELHRITPEEIHLTSLRVQARDEVSLRGRAFAMNNVFEYVKLLEESKLFEDVKAEYTKVTKLNRSQFAEFAINARCQLPSGAKM
jgi:Tfp pilus assembly protein PilN